MRSGRYFAYQYDTGNYPYSPYNSYSQPTEYKYSKFGSPVVLYQENKSKDFEIQPWMWKVGILALLLLKK